MNGVEATSSPGRALPYCLTPRTVSEKDAADGYAGYHTA